jgi:hypothetical protein
MYLGVNARPTAFSITRNYASKFRKAVASRSKIGCSVIATKGLVIRPRCLPDFHQTEIKVVLDLNQQIRICRIPDVISVADGLRHALTSYMLI